MNPGDTQPSPPPPPEPELERTLVHRKRPVDDLPDIAGVRLEGEIARGGMGVVYRGVQEYLSRPVAVKVLAAHLNAGDFVARFQREARILSGIAHPHIVGCYQAGVTDAGQCYMVMEFIDGLSLRRHVEANGPLPVPAALRMGKDLARALDHAWQAGVIHRDVKPENVVLQRATKVAAGALPFVPKLVDLGLARADSVADGLTAPGAVMGTYSTMAPEQFDAPDKVDFRADLYGLGCVLYFGLTGKAAFPEPSLALVIQRKLASPAPNPCGLDPRVPIGVGALVQAMLAAEPEQRPASYEAVAAECERLLAGRPATGALVEKTTLAPPPPPAPPRRGRALVIGGLAVIAVAAATVWFWPERDAPPNGTPPVVGDGETVGTKEPDGTGGAKNGGVKPPPPRVAPTLSVNAPAEIGPGEVLTLEADAQDADTPELTFRWEQVTGYPTPLTGADARRASAALADCVPGSALGFAITVSDGDHAPVRQEVTVRVVDAGAVPLFPGDPGDKLTSWQKQGDNGSWVPFDAFVINGYCDSGLTRLRTPLPRGAFSLFGKVELEAHHATKKLTPAAGLMLPQQEGAGALVLWLGPGEGDLVRGQLGGLASVDAWPPEPLRDGEATSTWPRPAVLHFHLVASEGELRVLWGAGVVWRRMVLGRPEGECCLELFVREGLARFHDLRR